MFSTVLKQIQSLIENPVFLACVTSWFSAQFLKTLIKLLAGKISSLPELFALLLWRTGGMPSSHSSLVTTLCATIGFRAGINSDIFVLSLGFALITIRDALGVRRASGIQAKVLNEVGLTLKEKGVLDFTPIKEVHGHKPMEVIFGCIWGVALGVAFSVL